MTKTLPYLCLLLMTLTTPSHAALDIWAPRQHAPAFVEPGGYFLAEVRGASSLTPAGWSASIKNELATWTASVISAHYGTIHQGKESGWRLGIKVPTNTPPELFELSLSHSTGGATNVPRAVKVVRSFEESFYILQLTDQHVDNQKAVKANGSSSTTWDTGSTESLLWAAPVINLINPRFVMVTGDNHHLYFGATSWCGMDEARRRVRIYYDALKQYSVPTCIVDGNHDIGYSSYTNSRVWRDTYEADIGQRVFSFRMGSFYVLGQEATYDEYLPWTKNDYATSWSTPDIKYRLIAQHLSDPWINVASATNPCNLMLIGHSHQTATVATSPYRILSLATAQDHQKCGFFSFERSSSGWNCPQATTHAEGVNVFTLFGDWGNPPKLAATFSRTNNGTQTSNTVSVVNNLPQNFYHGRVKFLMAPGNYAATGGEIEAQYDYNNGSNTAVLVKINFLKNTTTHATLTAVLDGNQNNLPDAWEKQYFRTTNSIEGTPTADPDNDGADNLAEYIAGTNPTNAPSRFALEAKYEQGELTIRLQTIAATGLGYETLSRYYDLETRTNLLTGTWQLLPTCSNLLGTGQILTTTNTPSPHPTFYRSKVRLTAPQ